MVGDNILAATKNGAFLVANGASTPVGRKPPAGAFGAVFAQGFDAICLSRPDGKLAFAAPNGRIKATIPFLKGDEAIEGVSPNLGQLAFCPPFIVSAARDCACFIINLTTTSLLRLITDLTDLVGMSSDSDRVLFLCRSKILLFRICNDEKEYIRYLADSGGVPEARKLVMEKQITETEILQLLKGDDDPTFTEYIENLTMLSKPKPLNEADPTLFEQVMSVDIPTKETMDAIDRIRAYCIFDESFRDKVDKYVVANPNEYEKWSAEIHANYVVPFFSESEETSELAMRIAQSGDSELCRLFNSLESRSLDFCVANSPPLRAFHFKGERRREFEEKLAASDPFVGDLPPEEEEAPLVDSLYRSRLALLDRDKIDAEKALQLLQVYEWESNIGKCIDELRTTVDMFLLSKQKKELPPWIEASIQNEKSGIASRAVKPDASGNWGLPVQLTTCPICGMKHNLGESVSSVAVFPCGHIFHVPCLHTRYCPICYSGCMKGE
jgi:hypothetical protein